MAKKEETSKVKYNWFQICNILCLGQLDRSVVKIKYEDKDLTEEEWRELLKKDGLNF